MRVIIVFLCVSIIFPLCISCKNPTPQENIANLTSEFLQDQIPELQDTRLLVKADLPERQQHFFDEADAQLQLLVDLNKNKIPEYIVTGLSESGVANDLEKSYFIAVFERQDETIKRVFFQQVYKPPVNLTVSKDSQGERVVISFAFYSGYGASIFFNDGTYQLEHW